MLLAAAAGCVGPDETPTLETAGSAPSDSEPAAGPPEMAEPAASPAPEPTTPAVEDAPTLATLALEWDGVTRPFVCVPTALPACGAALPSDGTDRYVPTFEGKAKAAHVVLTWDAETPLTEVLVLHVEGVSGCDDACHAMGSSPVTLSLDDIELATDWEFTIHAFVPCQVCEDHHVMMDPGQTFTISGELQYAPYPSS